MNFIDEANILALEVVMGRRLFSIFLAVGFSAVFLFVLLRLASPVGAGGVIVVNPGESIQAAIDGASDGDAILILAGTYTESLTLNKPVSLTGVSSATTILRAEPNDRVITVTGATITKAVVISGLMVTGGFIYNSGNGGGVLLQDFAHPSFIEVMFYDNWAVNGGGLWDEEKGAMLYFTRTSFVENYADEDAGGGMLVGDAVINGGRFIFNGSPDFGGAIFGQRVKINGSTFITNIANYGGGAVYASQLTVTNGFFTASSCYGDTCKGGAFHVDGTALISSTDIISNYTKYMAGAVFAESAKINDSTIIGNSCRNGSFCTGGAIYGRQMTWITSSVVLSNSSETDGGAFWGGNLSIYDSVIRGNSAETVGGAVAVYGQVQIVDSLIEGNHCDGSGCVGGAVYVTDTLTVSGTTFTDNTAVGAGGGVWAEGDAYIYDSQFIGNSAVDNHGAIGVDKGLIVGGRFEDNHCTNVNGCFGGAIGAGDLTMSGTEVLSNSGTYLGGALFGERITVTNSLLAYNACEIDDFCSGGAIYASQRLFVSGTQVLSNSAVDSGAGLTSFGPMKIVNSEIFDNHCTDDFCNGAGIFSSGPVYITGTTISSNTATKIGGGVYVGEAVSFYDSAIDNNSADLGGGAYSEVGITAVDSLFTGNEASNLGGGAFTHGWASITGTTFISNTAVGDGGGLWALVDADILASVFAGNSGDLGGGGWVSGSISIAGTSFYSNSAVGGGGGLYGNGPMVVEQSVFVGNGCLGEDCVGGGLTVYGTLSMTQSELRGNTAVEGQGAGLYGWQPDLPFVEGGSWTAVLVNNLFAENVAGFREGTVHFENGLVEMVHNTVVAGDDENNTGIYFYNSTASLTNTIVTSYSEAVRVGPFTFVDEDYNLFYDNFTIFSGEVNSGGNSIYEGDPDFVDPAAGDYHIGLDSAGLDNGLDLGVAVDLDGTPRPIGLGPDRGAYEASMVVPITGLTAENNGPTTLNADTTFTAMVVTGSGVNYVWDFGDGSQGSGQVVAHEYDDVGEYTAVVTASNSLGGMTATTMVLVFEEAIEGLVLVSDSPVELGQQVRLTATVEAGSNVFYSWDFGDGNQGPGPSVTNYFYNMAGVYTVTVTATNSADTVTAMTVVVVVGPAPEDEWFVFMPVMIRP